MDPVIHNHWGVCSRCGSKGLCVTVMWPDERPTAYALWCHQCQAWELLHVPELDGPEATGVA